MISVSGTFIVQRIANEPKILIAAMKNSSGQWCANSVTSNKSDVMRDMICPTFVLSKYAKESFCRWAKRSRRMSVSIFVPTIWPMEAMKNVAPTSTSFRNM